MTSNVTAKWIKQNYFGRGGRCLLLARAWAWASGTQGRVATLLALGLHRALDGDGDGEPDVPFRAMLLFS